MAALDKVIHEPVRLRIMAALAALEAGQQVEFTTLRDLLAVTDGNLGAHLGKLEEAGYVTRTRSTADNRVVIVAPTPAGKDVVERTPLGGLPLLRRRLDTLPMDRLLFINEALGEIMQLLEVTDSE